MLSEKKLLSLITEGAMALIPTSKLSEMQLERLDNITCEFCNCFWCDRFDREIRAHVDKKKLKIRISETQFKKSLLEEPIVPVSLLEWISTIIHEIVHIIHPRLNEDQTEKRSWQYFTCGIKKMWQDWYSKFIE